jgi:DME family drug/metabolite transporter
MPRLLVLLAGVGFGTTGTAQALGPDAAPLTVGASRIAIGGALLLSSRVRFPPQPLHGRAASSA